LATISSGLNLLLGISVLLDAKRHTSSRTTSTRADQSRAQLFQDVIALSFSGCKRNGYFVEIGACDGKFLSNTYLLEKEFGWTGIVVEPARVWEHDLHQNRSCLIDTRCVWPKSNQSIQFSETRIPEYSTTGARLDSDIAARFREKASNMKYLAYLCLTCFMSTARLRRLITYR
jgi:hypothetical protein